MTCRASGTRQALSAAAFSRSISPRRPSSCERGEIDAGQARAQPRRHRFLLAGVGQREDAADRHGGDAARGDVGGGGGDFIRIERGDRATIELEAARGGDRSARRSPRAGRRASPPAAGRSRSRGSPRRITAVGARSRRWITALVKWVVPIMIASSAPRAAGCASSTAPIAATIPPVTSALVGRLAVARTARPSSSAASVFVPPTSIPIRTLPPPLVPARRAPCTGDSSK